MKNSSKSKIVITVAGMAIMLCVGILYMWSVFLPYVTEYHGWKTSDVAMTSSIMMATFVLGNILGGAIKGMLPKGPLGRSLMDNLVVIEGADLQGHEAQKPKAIDINQYK